MSNMIFNFKRSFSAFLLVSAGLATNVIAEHWNFEKASEAVLLEKCSQLFESLEQNDMKKFAAFYPPELVAKYPESLNKKFKRKLKKYQKRTLRTGYKELNRKVSMGDNLRVVEINWSAENGMVSGNAICEFAKQENGNWAFSR